MPRGKCRIKDGWANEDSVIVIYDNGDELEMPASKYDENGYQPPVDRLPECQPKQGG